MSLQQLIIPGVIAGVFTVAVSLMAAVFNRPKNNADAASSIVAGAKIVVDMNVDEARRKDAKIVTLYARINRLKGHIRELRERLTHHETPPPLPGAYFDDDSDRESITEPDGEPS